MKTKTKIQKINKDKIREHHKEYRKTYQEMER